MSNMIVLLPVHYEQERISEDDNNNGLLYGIYYYDVPVKDLGTDNVYNNEIVNVEWFETEQERDLWLLCERIRLY